MLELDAASTQSLLMKGSPEVTAGAHVPGRTGETAPAKRDVGRRWLSYRDAMFREFTPLVKRLIRQYGKTAEQRQDLEGEIFCQFCLHLEAYDPTRGVPLRPYIVRLLSASVYTYARRQWKLEEREAGFHQTEEDHPSLKVDPTPQWVHRVSQQQIIAALPLSLTQLPERQRHVVIMRYYEQRSFEDIALCLGIKPATARSLLRHALDSLRKRISPQDCEHV